MNFFIKKLSKKISKDPLKLLLCQLICSLFFAVLYFYFEKWCINNFDKAKKLNLIKNNVEKDKLKNLKHHNFLYFVWFSLITQTTVGYGNMLPGISDIHHNISTIFNIHEWINMIQLISIFILAAYL